ncbi:DMT family transporter [Marispirochaeta aestuarii]|uniref:DMT family transporter n=1 Tax=Marispirochaeta aestuarii TaxID=1963862 RepID=UPI0029C7CC60|nr:DMT family transporter [Marispirochaeta aestuarii]
MQQNRKAELVLLFVTLLWGATFIATKQGLRSAPPVFFLGLRFLIAALLLLPICYRELKKITPAIFKRGLVLGVLMFTGYAFQNASLVYTTAGKSALITYFFALIVPFLQIPFTGKPLSRGNIIGLVIVVGGLVLLNLPSEGGVNFGDILAFGSAVSYAFFIIFLDRYGRHGSVPVLTFLQFALTAVFSFILSGIIESGPLILDANLVWSLFYLSFFGSFICLLLMNLYQRYVTPVKAVIIYAMEPVFAVLFAMIFLAEFFTPSEWAGAGLVIAGVILSDLYKDRKM